MPTDNVVLNAGTGGSTVRTFSDAAGNEWPAGVMCFATTVSPGANVLAPVMPGSPMPVTITGLLVNPGSATGGTAGALVQGAVTTAAPSYTTGQTSPFSIDTAGNLRVNLVTASPVPVTGTFWPTTQPISGTVTVNAGGGTFAVSASSLPLPTGAAQDSSVNGVLVSQGSATSGEKGPLVQAAVTTNPPTYTTAQTSPLSLDTSGNLRVNVVTGGTSGNVVQGSSTSGETGMLVQGAVTTSSPTYTTGQTNPLSIDTSGNLRVDVMAVGGVAATQSSFASSFPSTGTAIGAKSASGSTLQPLNLDSSGNLLVDVAAGLTGPQIGVVYNGSTPVTSVAMAFSASSAGTTSLVSGVSGKKVYVLRWLVSSNGAATVNLQSHTTTSLTTLTQYMQQYSIGGSEWCPGGIVITATGEGLDLVVGGTGTISGDLTYVQF